MTYKELISDAKKYFNKVSENSPFVAMFETRKYIASKIDLCVDRNEHLDVLEWDEYKDNYSPMRHEEYENKKKAAKEKYEEELRNIENEWMNRGKNSPDYHKL